MKVVYVAGPYRARTAWGIECNIHAAKRAGANVARMGAIPLIPHANTAHLDGIAPDPFWLDGTLEMMRRCDAVYCFCSEWTDSVGTRGEVEEACRLNIPVLFNLKDLAAWIRTSELES